MAVIVRGSIPADELALHHVLTTVPEVSIEVERIIESGEEAVMPLVWLRGADEETVEAAIAADPTVSERSCLVSFDDEQLYRMEWTDRVRLLLGMVTNFEATILDAFGDHDRWQFRVLYPDRSRFARTHDFCEEHGLTFDVEAVREMEGEPAGRYGLTDEQYETLVLAVQRGYFDVPRSTSLDELAEETDVSHQALSERLRRGVEALVEDTLLVGRVDES